MTYSCVLDTCSTRKKELEAFLRLEMGLTAVQAVEERDAMETPVVLLLHATDYALDPQEELNDMTKLVQSFTTAAKASLVVFYRGQAMDDTWRDDIAKFAQEVLKVTSKDFVILEDGILRDEEISDVVKASLGAAIRAWEEAEPTFPLHALAAVAEHVDRPLHEYMPKTLQPQAAADQRATAEKKLQERKAAARLLLLCTPSDGSPATARNSEWRAMAFEVLEGGPQPRETTSDLCTQLGLLGGSKTGTQDA